MKPKRRGSNGNAWRIGKQPVTEEPITTDGNERRTR
jgi:hypothetical protein